MNGGLMKTTSRFAIAAAASVLATSAFAADLGGNCCADLEERVAELEATTARKGNRKVSLTVSGFVNQAMMHWDDGYESNLYVGQTTAQAQSRFRFVGSARIDPKWSAGFLLEIGAHQTISNNQSAIADNGTAGVSVRHSAWWIEHSDLGRVWVGRTDMAGAGVAGIDLSGANIAGFGSKVGHWNSGFALRTVGAATVPGVSTGLTNVNWGHLLTHATGDVGLTNITREDTIKYVSPTLMGFIFSAAFGEDDKWDVALRYAGEHVGVRVAAGVTYAENRDGNGTGEGNCADLKTAANIVTANDVDCNSFQAGASAMHTATGLFVSGAYGILTDNNRDALALANNVVDDSGAAATKNEDTNWYLRAGIARNWTGLGDTILFGQYTSNSGTGLNNGAIRAANAVIGPVGGTTAVAHSRVDAWGLGAVQRVDAAAMELYVMYQNYSTDVMLAAGGIGGTTKSIPIKDFDAVLAGGRINF